MRTYFRAAAAAFVVLWSATAGAWSKSRSHERKCAFGYNRHTRTCNSDPGHLISAKKSAKKKSAKPAQAETPDAGKQ